MEKVNLKVDGMDCATCALTITKYLQKQGLQNVKVNFATGDVSYETVEAVPATNIETGIKDLGYTVVKEGAHTNQHEHGSKGLFKSQWAKFLFCLVFSVPLFFAHILHIHFLMNPWVQLGLTIPIFAVGMYDFGRSAIRSLAKGYPNMNVLITIGALAAFGYSLYGMAAGRAHEFMFFESAATIITLVFWGNYLEDKSIATTQAALQKLVVSQKITANMIAFDEHYQEQIFPVDSNSLRVGDLVLIKNGEYIPMDAKVLWGEANVNEAIVTGESVPVQKKMNDPLIGGSMVVSGTVKAQVTAVGDDTVMSHILSMVKEAQAEKPPVQQLADKISATFVPTVLSIALLTVLGNYFIGHHPFAESLIRSIAVLVIACPCAMGLATPAAVAVGLGRAAKYGILFKDAKSLEVFKDIRQVVFDKTGTLTTGAFTVTGYGITDASITDDAFKQLAFSLEKYATHPIAKAVAREWKSKKEIRWQQIEEVKGEGMKASDKEGNTYTATSYKAVAALTANNQHNVYITRNGVLLGWIDLADEIRPEAKAVIKQLHSRGINTILLSGDKKEKCDAVAKALNIDTVIAEQTPQQKIEKIAAFNAAVPTVMVGDGINDAPALAKATVGVSLSDASQVAMQSAQVILMQHGLQNLPLALGLGKHTYITIKENLFWAFAYNIVAIPVAAFGLLGKYGPTYGALIMGLSDVVLAINSIRLKWKRVL
jgi:Cu+-exporting ATPase